MSADRLDADAFCYIARPTGRIVAIAILSSTGLSVPDCAISGRLKDGMRMGYSGSSLQPNSAHARPQEAFSRVLRL